MWFIFVLGILRPIILLLCGNVRTLPPNPVQEHKCYSANIERKIYPECQRERSKCGQEICKSHLQECQAMYQNISGELRVIFLSCHNEGDNECLDDTCLLTFQPYHNLWHCCCRKPMCNLNIVFPSQTPTKPTRTIGVKLNETTENLRSSPLLLLVYVLVPFSVFIVIIGVVIFCIQKQKNLKNDMKLLVQEPCIETRDYLNLIHEGKFTKVWKAKYKGDFVAVKILLTPMYKSWQNEKDLFLTYDLKNEHLVNFISVDMECLNQELRYLILTEYHENGSLIDYLKHNILTVKELLIFMFGIVRGVMFLHRCLPSKPRIAHRDLKSANVLVTGNLNCVICDLGLAVAVDTGNSTKDLFRDQVGTNRYMAPEMLDGAIMFNCGSYFLVDIYSTALIMWEILSRCRTDTVEPGPYESPYFGEVGECPSIWQMKKCVVDRNCRPEFRLECHKDLVLNNITSTIEECWDSDPEARVSMNCVHERLLALTNGMVELPS